MSVSARRKLATGILAGLLALGGGLAAASAGGSAHAGGTGQAPNSWYHAGAQVPKTHVYG
jgi:hypothetical protein